MKAPSAAAFLISLLLNPHGMGSRPGLRSELDWSFKFQDYPARSVYKGKPARPLLVTETDRLFRATIRQAAQKGPNFAGQYAIAHWGCGSSCFSFVIVDGVTGRVYDRAPFGMFFVPFRGTSTGRDYEGLVYKLSSRLLVLDGCAEKNQCGTYYYEWRKNRFALLGFEPLEPSKE
jgi:hypothetical protein